MKPRFILAFTGLLILASVQVSFAENDRPLIAEPSPLRQAVHHRFSYALTVKKDTGGSPVLSAAVKSTAPKQGVVKMNQASPDSSSGSGSVDFFYKSTDFSGDGINGSPFELTPTGVTAGVYTIGNASITIDSKGRITAITMNGNSVPAVVSLTADDNFNTLQAYHSLGASEILVSVNDAAFIQYDGVVINVGNINRPEGYWKFKVKAGYGRTESGVVNSPAFTGSEERISKLPLDVRVTATILYSKIGAEFVESPPHTYSSSTQDVVFLTDQVLPENTDGIVYTSYPSPSSSIIFLGLDETQNSYNRTFSVYANTFTGTYYYIEGQSNIDTGVPLVADASARFGIRRIGSTLTEVISSDGGVTWRDIHTFNGKTTKALYIKFYNYKAGNTIVNPKILLP